MTLALQELSVSGNPRPWRAIVGVCRRGGLLLVWLDPFLTVEEQDRLSGWHLGVSLYPIEGHEAPNTSQDGDSDSIDSGDAQGDYGFLGNKR